MERKTASSPFLLSLSLSLSLLFLFSSVSADDTIHFVRVNRDTFVSVAQAEQYFTLYSQWFSASFDSDQHWKADCSQVQQDPPINPVVWVAGTYQDLGSKETCLASQQNPLLVGNTAQFDAAFWLIGLKREFTFGSDGFSITSQLTYAVVTPEGYCAEDVNGTCIVITSQAGQTNRFEETAPGVLILKDVDFVEDKTFVREYMSTYLSSKRSVNLSPNKLTPPQRLAESGGLAGVSMDHPALTILRERRLKRSEKVEL